MLIEQPPLLYRLLFPEAIWRIKRRGRKVVYLTFDDGPIPEVTPWVLDLLDKEGIKATFFVVGDNVRRNPELFEEIKFFFRPFAAVDSAAGKPACIMLNLVR